MINFVNYLLNKQWILRIVMHFLSKEKKERIYISKIRSDLASLGHDISDITDEEIKEATIKFGEVISKSGFAAHEAGKALRLQLLSGDGAGFEFYKKLK